MKTEKKIQDEIRAALELRHWYVIRLACGQLQKGVPDLWACHSDHGSRWIEVKRPKKYKCTPAQYKVFEQMDQVGAGVWVLTDAGQYNLLFGPPNWRSFFYHG